MDLFHVVRFRVGIFVQELVESIYLEFLLIGLYFICLWVCDYNHRGELGDLKFVYELLLTLPNFTELKFFLISLRKGLKERGC